MNCKGFHHLFLYEIHQVKLIFLLVHNQQQFKTIDLEYRLIFKNITERNNITDKKMFAHYALSYTNSSILFAMFDNKEYKHMIWKIIYPNYSKPFKNDKEN